MTQVHKENLTHVENAIGGRQGLDIEIFGMEGVPAEIVDSHNQQVTQKHFAEEAERARLRMEELRDTHSKLNEERTDKGRDIERRRVRIEQTEKKMAELKDNIENEVHAAHDEYLKMESHIKLYVTEMEQSI